MIALTDKEEALLTQLRENSEGDSQDHWREVYLDNCPLRHQSPGTFAGVLGSLTKKGLFRPIDDAFGEVWVEASAPTA